jgi:uncharacterized membrane protein YdbT with pleckstrin-like domain
MSYIEQTLLPNEQVVVKAERHTAAFIPPALLVAVGLFLIMTGGFLAFLGWVLVLIQLVVIAKIVGAFVTSEMALTTSRMVGKTGLIKRKSLDVRHGFVSGVTVDQSIAGRMLNYGTVQVRGHGDVEFDYVKNPLAFRNTVQGHLAGDA